MTKTDLIKHLRERQRELQSELTGVEAAITAMTGNVEIKRITKKRTELVCTVCNSHYMSRRSNSKFCSDKCRSKARSRGVVLVHGERK